MTSPLMKPTLVGRDTRHELDQPLKKLAYVSNHWGPLLYLPTPLGGHNDYKNRHFNYLYGQSAVVQVGV